MDDQHQVDSELDGSQWDGIWSQYYPSPWDYYYGPSAIVGLGLGYLDSNCHTRTRLGFPQSTATRRESFDVQVNAFLVVRGPTGITIREYSLAAWVQSNKLFANT